MRKEVGDVIAEGAIVGCSIMPWIVLYPANDARKGMFTEFSIGANFGIFLCHADVSFVYKGVTNAFFGVGIAPGVGSGGSQTWAERCGFVILNSTSCGRNPFAAATRPKHLQFVEVFVSDSFKRVRFDAGLVTVVEYENFLNSPVGEVTNEIEGGGVGRPFTKDPLSFRLWSPKYSCALANSSRLMRSWVRRFQDLECVQQRLRSSL